MSETVHEKRALSADMAMHLARLLNTTPESWLGMQQAIDLWERENERGPEYQKIEHVVA